MTALILAWLLAVTGVAVSDAPSLVTFPLLVGGLLITMLPLILSDLAGAALTRRIQLPDKFWLGAAAVSVSVVPVWGGWLSLSNESIRIGALFAAALLAFGLLLTWLVHRRGAPHLRIPFVFSIVQLTVFFITAHTVEETLVAVRGGTEMLRLAMFFGGWAASLSFALGWMYRIADAALVEPPRDEPRWRNVLQVALRIVAGLAGLVLLIADRNLFLGLYEGLHNWMLFLGIGGVLVPVTWALAAAMRRVSVRPALAALPVVVAVGFVAWLMFSPAAGDPFVRAAIESARTGDLTTRFREGAELGEGLESDDVELLRYEKFHDYDHDLPRHNIALVSVDTLRADWVGPTATHAGNTPRINELIAAEAAWFPRTYAPGPRTAISMSSLLIGRYSANLEWNLWIWHRGRVYDPAKVTDAQLKKFGKDWGYTTVPTFPEHGTIAQRLGRAGYYTMGAPFARNAAFFRKGIGFEAGFDDYRDLSTVVRGKPTSSKVIVKALEQIDEAPEGRPWFQWIHLFDPHDSRATPETYEPLVQATDKAIGELIDALKKRGVWDNTVFILVSDHGEAMKEHGYTYHGHSIYDEQVNVPMIVRVPGMEPRILDKPTSIIDAVPTLLSIAGAEMAHLDGVNLLPYLQTGEYDSQRPVFVEMHRYQGKTGKPNQDAKGIVVDNWKLIYERRKQWVKLFDLAVDPRETENLVNEHPIVARRLLQALLSWVNPREREKPLPDSGPVPVP